MVEAITPSAKRSDGRSTAADATRLRRLRGRTLAVLATGLGVAALAGIGGGSTALADNPNINPLDPITSLGDQFVPRKPGTKEKLKFCYGPYVIPPGWDANRVDLDIPLRNGMVLSVEPGMRRADRRDGAGAPGRAHPPRALVQPQPGQRDRQLLYGLADWIFGNGDEETRANFQERSAPPTRTARLRRPHRPDRAAAVIYMLHNKTAQPMLV